MEKVFNIDFYGQKLEVEIGKMAKQTNGAAFVKFGETAVLSCSVMSNKTSNADFFPLTVLYEEKLYSVGKIPGGFIKREGRPTSEATLAARLIDRPIRPMFDDGFRNEVQVINTILSVDPDNSPEITALFASSLALCISDIPFNGPVAGIRVAKSNGEFIINPSSEELDNYELVLTVAGGKDGICMIEANAKEASEEDCLKGIEIAKEAIKILCDFQEEITKEVGKPKIEVELKEISSSLKEEVESLAKDTLKEAITSDLDKLAKSEKIEEIKSSIIDKISESHAEDEELDIILKDSRTILDDLEANIVRDLILEEEVRPDGRALDEIRPLSCEIDLLPRTHGSALFTRGQTQSLSTTTLGALGEHQILDGLGLEASKRFMLHYNFPSFSVGETGRYTSPSRREIGHGALGEKALKEVMPSEEEFPYTVRVVSEILESNGSSSQASICAGCLSLMAAGVPIKAPVAGIAMGLMSKGDNYKILTDIQGLEDHMGDMDFKVAGTKDGITALQMDIKIKEVSNEILSRALTEAKKARLKILDVMADIIPEPRKELSPYAPKIGMLDINPERIKDVIGRGGEMITKIILEASNVKTVNDKDAVKVDISDEGHVVCYHSNQAIIDKTIEMIKNVTREVELGKIYTGKVVKVEKFGCFVELWPGCEGLVHISKLDTSRVEKCEDVVKVGDEILVKALDFDNRGRLNLSRKDAISTPKEEKKGEKNEETNN